MRMRPVLLAIAVAVLFLVLVALLLFGKRTAFLRTGNIVVTATSSGVPWNERVISVQSDGTDLFGIYAGMFEGPVFMYSFPDQQRYLCVYDDDTAVVVFVVDRRTPQTKTRAEAEWPISSEMLDYFIRRATNIVVQSEGTVRVPTRAEVLEVSDTLRTWTTSQFKHACFHSLKLGTTKEWVGLAVATNRQSYYPTTRSNP